MELEKSDKIIRALRKIRPNASFSVSETYSSLTWHDGGGVEGENQNKPTEQEFNDVVKAWQTEYDAKQYQRDRNYPDIGEQLDMLWHAIDNGEILGDKSCNFFKTLKKVKDDNPKPE